ncbi:hypothetical protein BDY24DRAFT_399408 [Mrakia frigida]|uniref:uncharacterized protein n=1 Tax=Mrakia frigida TaxID=29902 RepID=UPI003FCC142B
MGNIISAIGRGINAVISAIASLVMAIISGVTGCLVAIFNFLTCGCCSGGRKSRGGTVHA